MQVLIHDNEPGGVALRRVPFGEVVSRVNGQRDVFYLVISTMNGTGDRALVTLTSGSLKHVSQDTPVIQQRAMVIIGRGPAPREPLEEPLI